MTAETTESENDDVQYVERRQSSFTTHLFRLDDVREAGGDIGETSNLPVESLCSRRTNYGEFDPLDEGVDDLNPDDYCQPCIDAARSELDETREETEGDA
jgi:hypothetical protein